MGPQVNVSSTFLLRILFAVFFTATIFGTSQTISANKERELDHPKFELLKSCMLLGGVPKSYIVARDNPLQRSEYDTLNYQWDKLHGTITPLAFLVPTKTKHISTAVRCSHSTGVRIVPKSGGHSYLKLGFGDEHSFIVDLSRMNKVQLQKDPKTGETVVKIGPGARSGKMQYRILLQSNGTRIMPTPTCSTVGVGGFAQGGGFDEYHSREWGMGIDNILEMRMVDWTGDVLTISNRTNQDLFWALRGGGGGNFGIVTKFIFKTHPAPQKIGHAMVNFQLKDFSAFFKSWQKFIYPDPDGRIGTYIRIHDTILMHLFSTRPGENGGKTEVEKILATFPTPINATVKERTLADFMIATQQLYFDKPLRSPADLENVTYDATGQSGWKKVKSFYVDRILTSDEDVKQFYILFRKYFQFTTTYLYLEHYGGAVNTIGPTETAFIHRGQRALYSAQPFVFTEDGHEDLAAVEGMIKFFEGTKRLFGHTESYQNYMDEDMPDWLQRFYGTNLERLVAVKKKVDPHNVFRSPKSIPLSLSESNH